MFQNTLSTEWTFPEIGDINNVYNLRTCAYLDMFVIHKADGNKLWVLPEISINMPNSKEEEVKFSLPGLSQKIPII